MLELVRKTWAQLKALLALKVVVPISSPRTVVVASVDVTLFIWIPLHPIASISSQILVFAEVHVLNFARVDAPDCVSLRVILKSQLVEQDIFQLSLIASAVQSTHVWDILIPAPNQVENSVEAFVIFIPVFLQVHALFSFLIEIWSTLIVELVLKESPILIHAQVAIA